MVRPEGRVGWGGMVRDGLFFLPSRPSSLITCHLVVIGKMSLSMVVVGKKGRWHASTGKGKCIRGGKGAP